MDCTVGEERWMQGELVMAKMASLGEVTHVHYTGVVSMEELNKAMERCSDMCDKIRGVMVQSLIK